MNELSKNILTAVKNKEIKQTAFYKAIEDERSTMTLTGLSSTQQAKLLGQKYELEIDKTMFRRWLERNKKRLLEKTEKNEEFDDSIKKNMNILVMNMKGGTGCTVASTIIAPYLENTTLVEIDRINGTVEGTGTEGHFKVHQVKFNSWDSEGFLEFENLLLSEGTRVIDVSGHMCEIFHHAMTKASLYEVIDLLIVPAMDGVYDFDAAMRFLDLLDGNIPADKIMFAFSRYNPHEYGSFEEQFDLFFDNKSAFKKQYGIDFHEDNYFAIQNSKAFRHKNSLGTPIESLEDEDYVADFIVPMLEKIRKKLNIQEH